MSGADRLHVRPAGTMARLAAYAVEARLGSNGVFGQRNRMAPETDPRLLPTIPSPQEVSPGVFLSGRGRPLMQTGIVALAQLDHEAFFESVDVRHCELPRAERKLQRQGLFRMILHRQSKPRARRVQDKVRARDLARSGGVGSQ